MPNQGKKFKDWTDTEVATIRSMALGVWQDLGYDCLYALAEDRGKDINDVYYRRAEVLDIVVDADRLSSKLDPPLLAKFQALDYASMLRLIRPAFTYDRYGL